MSQSPVTDLSAGAAFRYKQGWRALNRLLNEGRSFSGHEKNVAFLNCGDRGSGPGAHQGFADISAAIGFDLPDDGRGLALVDWDFDGDLDVWLTNRTAPRLRLMRNGGSFGNRFLAVRLVGDGTSTNRDAVGARVEVRLAGRPGPLVRTLHAGHGFLSQSSAWLHFGLGPDAEIESVVVRWPGRGAAPSEFRDVAPDGFLVIDQAAGAIERWAPPAGRRPLAVAAPGEFAGTGAAEARVVVPPGMPLPRLEIEPAVGADPAAGRTVLAIDRPAFVNLWASWCAPCIAELSAWSQEAERWRALGLDVVLLNADAAGDAPGAAAGAEAADADAVLDRLGVGAPFRRARAGASAVRRLDALQCAVLDRWEPLPVPSSFLVDGRGEVVVIYKGPVSLDQVAADAGLLSADAEARRDAAVPFPGRWVGPPTRDDPKRVATQLLDRDDVDGAIDYLRQIVDVESAIAADEDSLRELGDACFFLGTLLEDRGAHGEARPILEKARDLVPGDVRFRTALARTAAGQGDIDSAAAEQSVAIGIRPDDPALREDLAQFFMQAGRHRDAVAVLAEVVAAHPDRAPARFHLANEMRFTGQFREAIDHYRKTLGIAPKTLDAANNLAWILATHPDPELRSGREALALADRLCRLTRHQDPRYLDTLAAAQAETGDFTAAAESAAKAVALQRAAAPDAPPRDATLAEAMERRLAGYRKNAPYRESAWNPDPGSGAPSR